MILACIWNVESKTSISISENSEIVDIWLIFELTSCNETRGSIKPDPTWGPLFFFSVTRLLYFEC